MIYSIKYKAQNKYVPPVKEAIWQFLLRPEDNLDQTVLSEGFTNSLELPVQSSINGFGFKTYRIHSTKNLQEVDFNAYFRLEKKTVNPFSMIVERAIDTDLDLINTLDFKVEHEPYRKETALTRLPREFNEGYTFDPGQSLFNNIRSLNTYIFEHFSFRANVTGIDTSLREILEKRQGVCQDFTHLFCALSRKLKIPARYVSGYLNQGRGFHGDMQMHAWAECFLPGIGWLGFDPTNNLLAAENHIKVAHGKDYADCPPIKGIVYSTGVNTTTYTVEVSAEKDVQVQTGTIEGMSQKLDGMEQRIIGSSLEQEQAAQQQ